MMEIKTKKTFIIGAVILLIGGGVVFLGRSELFSGRLGKQLAFFREAPEKEKVIDGNFVSLKDAAAFLANASLNAGAITNAQAQEFIARYQSGSKITRAELAALAAEIFALQGSENNGPTLIDVTADSTYARDIALCVSHGCIDVAFKPGNQATWDFLQKVGGNLSKRAGAVSRRN